VARSTPSDIASGAVVIERVDSPCCCCGCNQRRRGRVALPPSPEQALKNDDRPMNNRRILAFLYTDSTSLREVERVQPAEELTVARQPNLEHRWHRTPVLGPVFPLEEIILVKLVAF